MFKELLAPKLVRWGLALLAVIGGYDTVASQAELPTLRDILGMSGALLPWWGWLLILQAILVYALFEYVRRMTFQASTEPHPAIVINTREKEKISDLRSRVKQLEDSKKAPGPELDSIPGVSFTAEEKRQAKDILVDLANLTRERWVPLFDSARWLHGAQDVYVQHLDTLPALQAQAETVAVEMHTFQCQHEHMLSIMGIDMVELGRAASNIVAPIQRYSGRVSALGDGLSDGAIQLLQSLAEPVRDAFAHYDSLISRFQHTITRMRKEIDA
jgi:hypothetical protein